MPSFSSIAAFTDFLAENLDRMEEAEARGMQSAANLLVEVAKDLIGTEDHTWAPLADSTIEEKQRLGYVNQVSPTDPLLRTGSLRASIKGSHEPTGLGSGTVDFGSDDPVAAYQEFGTDRGIPPRPFIGAALFREGRQAAERVLNYEMGALVGRSGPLIPIQRHPHEPLED
jgi:hypothetical protein